MFARFLIVFLTVALASCQTMTENKMQRNSSLTKIEAPEKETEAYAFESKEAGIKDIASIIEDVEREFSTSVIETERRGSSVRFYLPHHASFDTDSFEATKPLKKEIDFILSKIDDYDYHTVKTFGFADSRGDKQYNKNLSEKRAKSVSNFIKNRLGEGDIVISSHGIGEEMPVAKNETSYGRLLNRRTEVVVYF